MAKRGGVPKRTKAQRLEDFNFITPLFLRGGTYSQITAALNGAREYEVNYACVYADIKKILDQWKTERLELIDAQKVLELKKIDHLEAIYFQAWEESRMAKVKTVNKRKGLPPAPVPGARITTTQVQDETHTTESVGDSRWLLGIQWCIEQRCQIIGLKVTGADQPALPANVDREIIFKTRSRRNEAFDEAIEVDQAVEDPNNIANKKLLS